MSNFGLLVNHVVVLNWFFVVVVVLVVIVVYIWRNSALKCLLYLQHESTLNTVFQA